MSGLEGRRAPEPRQQRACSPRAPRRARCRRSSPRPRTSRRVPTSAPTAPSSPAATRTSCRATAARATRRPRAACGTESERLTGVTFAFLEIRCRGGQRARRALPDRRQLARLPGVLRAAGVDRDLDGRADQRDLRLRLDAREAAHRARPEADGRRLGRGLLRAQGDLGRLQGHAPVAARPAARAVAAPRAARRGVRLPQRQGRRLRGRRRHRLDRRASAREQGVPVDDRHRRPRRLPAHRPRVARARDGDRRAGSPTPSSTTTRPSSTATASRPS